MHNSVHKSLSLSIVAFKSQISSCIILCINLSVCPSACVISSHWNLHQAFTDQYKAKHHCLISFHWDLHKAFTDQYKANQNDW